MYYLCIYMLEQTQHNKFKIIMHNNNNVFV